MVQGEGFDITAPSATCKHARSAKQGKLKLPREVFACRFESIVAPNEKPLLRGAYHLVQGEGFEPSKANANRFTVCRV